MISEVFSKQDEPRITAIIAGFFGSCADGKQYVLEIKEKRKRRSLDANAYFWVLADKIAAKSSVTVTNVYRAYVREIGGNSDIVCVKEDAADKFCEVFESRGLGWIAEQMPSKLPGCVNVICYYGSSTYDKAQMSRLIELAIQDCQSLGIEYLTPAELAAMVDAWGGDSDAG